MLVEGCRDSDWQEYENYPLVKDCLNLTENSRTFYRSFKDDALILPCRIKHVPFINSLRICASLNCTYGDFGYVDQLLRFLYNRNKINFKNNNNGNRAVYVTKNSNKKNFWTKVKRVSYNDVNVLYGYNVLILLDNFNFDELFNLLIRCDENVYFEGSFNCFIQTTEYANKYDAVILDKIIDDIFKLPIYYDFVRTPFKCKKNILEDNKCAICKEITTNVSYVKSYCRISDEIQAMEFICTSCISENMSLLEIGFMQDCHIPDAEIAAKIKDITFAELDVKDDVVFKFSRPIPLSFLGVTNTIIINYDENGTNKNINTKMNISSGNPGFSKLLDMLKYKISEKYPKIEDYPFSNNVRLWPSFKVCRHRDCMLSENKVKADDNRGRIANLLQAHPSIKCNRYITYVTDKELLDKKKDGVFDINATTLSMISNCVKPDSGWFYNEMPIDEMQTPCQILLLRCELSSFRLSRFNNKNFILVSCNLDRLIFGPPTSEEDTIDDLFKRMIKYNVPQSEAEPTRPLEFADEEEIKYGKKLSDEESDKDDDRSVLENLLGGVTRIEDLEKSVLEKCEDESGEVSKKRGAKNDNLKKSKRFKN